MAQIGAFSQIQRFREMRRRIGYIQALQGFLGAGRWRTQNLIWVQIIVFQPLAQGDCAGLAALVQRPVEIGLIHFPVGFCMTHQDQSFHTSSPRFPLVSQKGTHVKSGLFGVTRKFL